MTITWTIDYLPYIATQDSLSNVAKNIYWTVTNTETVDGKTYTVNYIGANYLNDPDPSSFTAYNSVTEEDAVSWLKAILGTEWVTKYEQIVIDKLTEAKNGKSYPLKYHAEYETTGIFKVGKSGEEPQDLHMTKPF